MTTIESTARTARPTTRTTLAIVALAALIALAVAVAIAASGGTSARAAGGARGGVVVNGQARQALANVQVRGGASGGVLPAHGGAGRFRPSSNHGLYVGRAHTLSHNRAASR